MSTIIHTGAVRSGTGYERPSQPRTQTSVDAKVSTDQTHYGKPPTLAQQTTAQHAQENATKATIQRQAASTSVPKVSPTTTYTAQGQVHSIEKAATGHNLSATA